MKSFLELIILLLFWLIPVIITVAYLKKQSELIYNELNHYKFRANNALNKNELIDIRNELITYAKAKCWHNCLTSEANQVLSFINGRLKDLN